MSSTQQMNNREGIVDFSILSQLEGRDALRKAHGKLVDQCMENAKRRLSRELLHNGITVTELNSTVPEMTMTEVSRVVSGERLPKVNSLSRICQDKINCSCNYILFGYDVPMQLPAIPNQIAVALVDISKPRLMQIYHQLIRKYSKIINMQIQMQDTVNLAKDRVREYAANNAINIENLWSQRNPVPGYTAPYSSRILYNTEAVIKADRIYISTIICLSEFSGLPADYFLVPDYVSNIPEIEFFYKNRWLALTDKQIKYIIIYYPFFY